MNDLETFKQAIFDGQPENIDDLLKSIDITPRDRRIALLHAAKAGRLYHVKAIVGAMDLSSPKDLTAINAAVKHATLQGHAELLIWLVDEMKEIELSVTTRWHIRKKDPILIGINSQLLSIDQEAFIWKVVYAGHLSVIKAIVQRSENPAILATLLLKPAASAGNQALVTCLIEEFGADLKTIKHFDFADYLKIIYETCIDRHPDIALLLLKHFRANDEELKKHFFDENDNYLWNTLAHDMNKTFTSACQIGYKEIVTFLLENNEIDPDAVQEGFTWVLRYDKTELFNVFFDKGRLIANDMGKNILTLPVGQHQVKIDLVLALKDGMLWKEKPVLSSLLIEKGVFEPELFKELLIRAASENNIALIELLFNYDKNDSLQRYVNSALYAATKKGHEASVNYFLENHRGDLKSAFLIACEYGHLPLAQKILAKAKIPEVRHTILNAHNGLAFLDAVKSQNIDLVKWLQKEGINYNQGEIRLFKLACSKGNKRLADFIRKRALTTRDTQTMASFMIDEMNKEWGRHEVENALIKCGHLSKITYTGDESIIKKLISNMSETELQRVYQTLVSTIFSQALQPAASNHNHELIEHLFAWGARPNDTLLGIALEVSLPHGYYANNDDTTAALLLHHGATPTSNMISSAITEDNYARLQLFCIYVDCFSDPRVMPENIDEVSSELYEKSIKFHEARAKCRNIEKIRRIYEQYQPESRTQLTPLSKLNAPTRLSRFEQCLAIHDRVKGNPFELYGYEIEFIIKHYDQNAPEALLLEYYLPYCLRANVMLTAPERALPQKYIRKIFITGSKGAFHLTPPIDYETMETLTYRNQWDAANDATKNLIDVVCTQSDPDIYEPRITELLSQGAKIQFYQNIALEKAIWRQNANLAKFLMANGADIKNCPGAITQAIQLGATEMLTFLLDQGAPIQNNIDNYFFHAVDNSSRPSCQWLLNNMVIYDNLLIDVFYHALKQRQYELACDILRDANLSPDDIASIAPSILVSVLRYGNSQTLKLALEIIPNPIDYASVALTSLGYEKESSDSFAKRLLHDEPYEYYFNPFIKFLLVVDISQISNWRDFEITQNNINEKAIVQLDLRFQTLLSGAVKFYNLLHHNNRIAKSLHAICQSVLLNTNNLTKEQVNFLIDNYDLYSPMAFVFEFFLPYALELKIQFDSDPTITPEEAMEHFEYPDFSRIGTDFDLKLKLTYISDANNARKATLTTQPLPPSSATLFKRSGSHATSSAAALSDGEYSEDQPVDKENVKDKPLRQSKNVGNQ